MTHSSRNSRKPQQAQSGSGHGCGTEQGPLIDEKAVEKVEEFIADAKAKGGRIVTGGKRHELGGTFFEPTVIAKARATEMRFTQEEIFGPVCPSLSSSRMKKTPSPWPTTRSMALPAYFYTCDLGRAFRVMEGLKYGLIGVNEGIITTVEAPFGGLKESGIGKEGGHQGIEDYLDNKYVCIGGLGL